MRQIDSGEMSASRTMLSARTNCFWMRRSTT